MLYFKWAVLALIVLGIAVWQWDNLRRQYNFVLRTGSFSPVQENLLRIAKWQAILLVSILICAYGGMIWYDYTLKQLREEEDPELIPALPFTEPTAITPAPHTTVDALPRANTSLPNVEDIFEPTEEPGLPQHLDLFKQKYEESLVSYFYMRRCGLAQPQDYHIILSAMMQELATMNAPAGIQKDILSAARGSYNELYIRSPCTAESVQPLYEQYTQYLNQLISTAPQQ